MDGWDIWLRGVIQGKHEHEHICDPRGNLKIVKIWHARALRWCTQYAGFPKSVQFQRFDPCARVRSRTAGPYHYAGPTKGGWWSELETWRWGGWLSSPPDLWVLLIPSRLKAWLLLDMNASLIRGIIFAACKLLGGATPPFSRRGSSSRLCRVINFHLREAVVLLQQERLSTSQQIPFKR